MKPDYKNWVPKGMVNGLIAGTLAACVLFVLFDTTDGTFTGHREAAWLGLAGSTLLVGKK